MGQQSSKFQLNGTLMGAPIAPLDSVALPKPLRKAITYEITVPAGKKSGDIMLVLANEGEHEVRIPREGVDSKAGRSHRTLKAGDVFSWLGPGDTSKVLTSTLPTLVGYQIVKQEPVIWSTTMQGLSLHNMGDNVAKGFQHMSEEGIKRANCALLQKALDVGCNAVLGITVSLAIDSSDDNRCNKMAIVTMTGTPCIVVSTQQSSNPQATYDGAKGLEC